MVAPNLMASIVGVRNPFNISNNLAPSHPDVSVVSQCELPDINRSSVYYSPIQADEYESELIGLIDKVTQVWAADITHVPTSRGFMFPEKCFSFHRQAMKSPNRYTGGSRCPGTKMVQTVHGFRPSPE